METDTDKLEFVEVLQMGFTGWLTLLYCLLISITFLAFINKAKTIGIITIIMAMGMAVLGYLWFTSSM